MERRMSSMTQMEIAKIISERKPVILPTGATEAHGPHMPTDTDTHQAEYIAIELAEKSMPSWRRRSRTAFPRPSNFFRVRSRSPFQLIRLWYSRSALPL